MNVRFIHIHETYMNEPINLELFLFFTIFFTTSLHSGINEKRNQTHEYEYGNFYEPMNYISDKSMEFYFWKIHEPMNI